MTWERRSYLGLPGLRLDCLGLSMKWLVVVVALGCSRTSSSTDAQASPSFTPPGSASPAIDADATIHAQLDTWNAALAKRDAHALEPLYAPVVLYYGTRTSNAERGKLVEGFFAKTADYTQSIRDVHVEHADASTARLAQFTKTATAHGATKDYPSYVVFDEANRIVEESDAMTDANLRKMATKRAAAREGVPTTCFEALAPIDGFVANHFHVAYPGAVPGDFSENVLANDGRYCTEVHKMVVDDPATGAGHAPRMASWCIDKTGSTNATGGWSMLDSIDHEVLVVVPDEMRNNVKKLCASGIPDPQREANP